MIGGRIFDTSAILDFSRGRGGTQYTQAVVWSSLEDGLVIVVPAPAVAAAIAQLPDHRHDVVDVLLGMPITVVTEITRGSIPALAQTLRAANARAAYAGTIGAVALAAQQRGWPVLTREPAPLSELWPDVRLEVIP
ncbi:hypothetical protein AB0F17_35160 [Nonomuraea sp. NPDC026600]|uniref:hypothetical protein n=1 Tax=Nonomuraea sp. NPDC026600 TaxID=3155363 RepID=UPI0033E9E647